MTSPAQDNQAQTTQPSDKELNFRALEQRYQKQLEQERAARLEAERIAQERVQQTSHDDDDDDEPYVNKKKLDKKLSHFGEQTKKQTKAEIDNAVNQALYKERQQSWLNQNKDFHEIMKYAEKLYEKDPELAETILEMPESFERQKLVYKNIKALNLHVPQVQEPSIQEKIDKNRRSPYYQPSGVGTSPYQSMGNFSPTGQKEAYDKMQELKSRLRL